MAPRRGYGFQKNAISFFWEFFQKFPKSGKKQPKNTPKSLKTAPKSL
jgi:hypothetical protein